MHLDIDQVLELFQRVPYLKVMGHQGARHYLAKLVRDGEELTHMLRSFPRVLYWPLDDHYACLVCQGATTRELIEDLCDPTLGLGWRGVVGASWLVALTPDPVFRIPLLNSKERAPRNEWIVDLAINEIDGVTSDSHPEIQSLIRRLRASLAGFPRPTRAFARAKAVHHFEMLQLDVAAAYRAGGAKAACAVIKASKVVDARELTYTPPPAETT